MKLALVAMLALPLTVQATQCIGLPYCARIGRDSVFFVGEVIESHDTGERQFTGNAGPSPAVYEVRLRVVEAFLGANEGGAVTVFTTNSSGPGTKLFIEGWSSPDGKIRTGVCPEMIVSNESMLDFLRRAKQGRGDGTSLTIFSRDGHSRSVEATVSIHGPVERTAIEGPKGGFRFEAIPAGHYQIHASRPGYALKHESAAVDVLPNACAIGLVEMTGARRIAGIVRTAEGKPASGARITVVARQSESDHEKSRVASASEFGRYEVANLPPGEYTVMAQPRELDFPVFYPGRAAPEEAGTVRLQPGEDREVDLTLFAENQQAIRFHFVNATGRPLPNLSVDFWRESDGVPLGWQRLLTDERGTWTITLIQNARYRLRWATQYQETRPVGTWETFVADMDLTPGETTTDVTVVFRRPGL